MKCSGASRIDAAKKHRNHCSSRLPLERIVLQMTRIACVVLLVSCWVNLAVCYSTTTSERASIGGAAHPSSVSSVSRVVVVGGGVGGLAVAARISSSSITNSQVMIVEKNSHVGGRCGSFHVETRRGIFRHERGPSLLLLQQYYQDLFQECSGKSAKEYGLEMKQCIPAYQVVFEDGDTIELGFPVADTECQEAEQVSRAKMDSYEQNGAKKWDEYMQSNAAFLDCGLPNFIEERLDLPSFPAFLVEALRNGAKAWPLKPHSDVLDATFDSQKMRAMASFQNLYVGLEPFRNEKYLAGGVLRKTAPAVFGLLAAIELHPSNKNAGGTCRRCRVIVLPCMYMIPTSILLQCLLPSVALERFKLPFKALPRNRECRYAPTRQSQK